MELDDEVGFKYPEWQKIVQAALIEVDKERLEKKVADAEAAIFQRLQALGGSSNPRGERLALEEASRSLLVVKTEILKYPAW